MNFIQYIKQAWKAGTSGGTPLSPDRLNHMEDGIKNNNDMISELNNNIVKINSLKKLPQRNMALFFSDYGNSICDELNLSQYSLNTCKGICSYILGSYYVFICIGSGDIMVTVMLNSKLEIAAKYIFRGTKVA